MYPGTGAFAAQMEMQVRKVQPAGRQDKTGQAGTHTTLPPAAPAHPRGHAHKNRGPARTGMLQPPRFSFSDCRPSASAVIQIKPTLACTSPTTWQQCSSTQPIPPSHLGTCTWYCGTSLFSGLGAWTFSAP